MTPAVIYTRFSPKPDPEDEKTLQTQEHFCRQWCELKGFTILDVFREPRASGASMRNRPELEKAITICCKHKGILVVYSLSRLARNAYDALTILERLRRCGAELAMLDLGIDTTTPTGKAIFTIIAAVVSLDRESKAAMTADGMRRKFQRGERGSSAVPFGYKEDENSPLVSSRESVKTPMRERFVPCEREQDILRRIRRFQRDGLSYAKVASALNSMHLWRRGDRPWTRLAVFRAMKPRKWDVSAVAKLG